MKKYIIMIALLTVGAATTRAQTLPTIDTAYHFAQACKVTPFKAAFNDTCSVNHLSVRTVFDDYKTHAVFAWQLTDAYGFTHVYSTLTVDGANYASLLSSTNPLYPYILVGRELGLTFVTP